MNKLKEVRFFKGVSQFKLGMLSRVHPSKISLYENNLVKLKPEEKKQIADALDITLEEVFEKENLQTQRK